MVPGVQKLGPLAFQRSRQARQRMLEGQPRAVGHGLDNQRSASADTGHELDPVVVVLVIQDGPDGGHALVEPPEAIEALLHIVPEAGGVGVVQ